MTGLPEAVVSAGSAVWLGLLTSISPCPLATNVAAISYLGRRVDSPRHVLGGGLLYTAGRTVAYVALGFVFVMGLLSMPETSQFLQRHMNRILGPVLIVAGILLLEVFRPVLPGLGRRGERLRQHLEAKGVWGALPLGALFALSFCPVSAALFFGSLVPLAVRFDSPVLIPTLYGDRHGAARRGLRDPDRLRSSFRREGLQSTHGGGTVGPETDRPRLRRSGRLHDVGLHPRCSTVKQGER